MKTTVLNPFTLDPLEHSNQHGIEFLDEHLTVQDDVEASDINTIVRIFGVTGEVPHGRIAALTGDFTDLPTDYHTAQNLVLEAQNIFMELPSQQRDRFQNDPGQFLDFIHNSSNYDEAVKLGFIPPKENPPPLQNGSPDPKEVKTTPTAPPGVNDAAHSST